MAEQRTTDFPEPAHQSATEPRSAVGVLAILGAIIAIPLLALAIVLLARSGDDATSSTAAEGVREGRIQSVELTNQRVLFGRLEELSEGWLVLRDAYFLRRSDAAAATGGADPATAPGAGVELVSIEAEQGGDGDVVLNADDVVLFQNLAEDAQIATEIERAGED